MSEGKVSSKERIIFYALELFAEKGYTETSVREIAEAVGIKEGSIYHHFPSKSSILEHLIDLYVTNVCADSYLPKSLEIINAIASETGKGAASADDILACFSLDFPSLDDDRYFQLLHVILHEQYRSPLARDCVVNHIINSSEKYVKLIINNLTSAKLIKETDSDFWAKIHSSIIYTYSSLYMLGAGDNTESFEGKGMIDMLRSVYELMLNLNSTQKKPSDLLKWKEKKFEGNHKS
jgi:AcrR family transcriptional regulator